MERSNWKKGQWSRAEGRCGKAQGGWGLEEAAISFTLEKLARMGRRGCGI